MTATTPDNGFRARLRRAARGTVGFAIALALCGAGGAPALAADGDGADPSSVSLHLTAGVRGMVSPGGAVTASITVQNDGDAALSAGRVEVEIDRTPLADQAELSSWLADEGTDDADDFVPLGGDDTTAVDGRSEAITAVTIPQESVADLAPGVYRLRAQLDGATTGTGADAVSQDAAATSVLVIAADQRPQVTVLVPITATPAARSLLTRDELIELTAPDGDLTAQLEGVSGTSAVLAVDPSIPAAIRALGTAAPAQVTEWLDRLDRLPNERFALQFGDADATTQSQAGLPALLQPNTLAPFLQPSDFQPRPDATGAPTTAPTPTPTGGPQFPDDETLMAVDGAVQGILWPRGGVTPDDLSRFTAYAGDTVTSVLPSTSLAGTPSGHVTIDGHDVLVADAAASDALSDAAAEPDTAARGRALAAANAALFFTAQATGGAPLMVGLDRDDNRTADALREAIVAADSPGVGLSSLRAAPPVAGTLADEPGDARGTSLQMLLAEENELIAFSSILDDPQVLLSPERIRILRVIGVGSSAKRFDADVAAHRTATRETLAAVDIPQSSTIQLLTANADLPFSVRNDLPWPVNIRLTVKPSDPRLEVDPVTPATIQAGTTSRVKVPVSARVGSGELNLGLSLSSPTGVPLGQPQSVRVAVRAEWEGIGLAVFGGLIVVLIVLGVFRTVHRRRREADGTDADGADAAGADPAGADADPTPDRGVE